MSAFWWLLVVLAVVRMIQDFAEVSEKGYWQVTKERQQRIFGGAFKAGRFFLRSYLKHHR